jgi:hypothetical protein
MHKKSHAHKVVIFSHNCRAADQQFPNSPYFLVDSSSLEAPVGRPLMNQKLVSPFTTNSSRDAETVSGG